MGRRSPFGIEGTGASFRDPDSKGRPQTAMVKARDQLGKWQSKRFTVTSWRRGDNSPIVPPAALEWVRDTRTDFVKGNAVAGVSTFQEFATALAENLDAAGIGKERLALIKSVADGLKTVGVTDMRTEVFPARVRKWITDLETGWSFAEDAKNKPLNPQPLSPATRNKILTICRQVTGLAVRRRRLTHDPLEELPRFKEASEIEPTWTIEELSRLVSDDARNHTKVAQEELKTEIKKCAGLSRSDAIQSIAKKRKCHWTTLYNILRRDPKPDPWWLACCLLVYTGARSQEALNLRWEWIKWDQNVITLKLTDDYEQKTNSERLIPLEPELKEILLPLAKTSGHILPTEIRAGGSGMRTNEDSAKTGKGARDYTNALRLYCARIGIGIGERTAKSFRHTYISIKIARDDQNLDKLRKAVGHAKITTTQGYSKLSQLYETEVAIWPDRWLWLRRPVLEVAQIVGKAKKGPIIIELPR